MINYNKLTPVLFNISNEDPGAAHKLDIAESMLEQCIREGTARYQGADGPQGYAPDYAGLKAAYGEDGEAANAGYNAWRRRWQKNYTALTGLWKVRDYAGMVALMEQAEAEERPAESEG